MAATYGTLTNEDVEKGTTDTATIHVVDEGLGNEPPTMRSAYQNFRKCDSVKERAQYAAIIYGILCTSMVIIVVTSLLSIIPFYMLIVGSIHIDDCNVQRYIPIYLIVDGIAFFARSLSFYCYRCIHKSSGSYAHTSAKQAPVFMLMNLFMLAWLICGSVWVFGSSPDFADPRSPAYCDKLTYVSAFIYIIVQWLALPVVLFIACCIMAAAALAL